MLLWEQKIILQNNSSNHYTSIKSDCSQEEERKHQLLSYMLRETRPKYPTIEKAQASMCLMHFTHLLFSLVLT